MALLVKHGVSRSNRNSAGMGDAIVAPWPVTTVYANPCQRVIFWHERDANPFFHLYEALWMLQGRNDVAPLARYAQQMWEYSDDEATLHGAYGYRWRYHFQADQLVPIAESLRKDPNDRRCVLQMWDNAVDLNWGGKDVPCNVIATFQRGILGELNLDVFCRSNDIVWGAYGANAVHFSILLEYMAAWIGCPIGVYRQHSVNFHAYRKQFDALRHLAETTTPWSVPDPISNPYDSVKAVPLVDEDGVQRFDAKLKFFMEHVDKDSEDIQLHNASPFFQVANAVFRSHRIYRSSRGVERFSYALNALHTLPLQLHDVDWIVAAKQWYQRRYDKWKDA
jgi:thymidylate synthase